VLEKLITKVTIATMVTMLCGGAVAGFAQEEAAQQEAAQEAAAEPQGKQWQDGKVEYDLYEAARTATVPAEQLKALDAWKDKYSSTDYEVERRLMYMLAYQGLQQPNEMYEAAQNLVAMGRDTVGTQIYFQGVYFLTTLTTSTAREAAEYLDNGEKYARDVLETMKQLERPEGVAEAAWNNQLHGIEVAAQTTIGWVAMKNGNNVAAEREFRELLKLDPQNAQASYWLASMLLAQKDADKQQEAFFHFARAGNYAGPGAMPPSNRQTVADYAKKIYVGFHGDESGLDDLIAMAQRSAVAPRDLRIKSKQEIEIEEENRMQREEPARYLWLSVKKQLVAPDGTTYFENSMKTRLVAFEGYLVAQSPPDRPTTLVLAMSDRSTREVTINLNQPFRYGAAGGTRIRFSGVPTSFRQEPFMLTLDADQRDISGWPAAPDRQE